MKTRNTKGKTIPPAKAVPAKKNAPGKNPPSLTSAKKKAKSAGKPPEKSAEAGERSLSLKKAVKKSLKVRKNLPAGPAPAAKKKSAGKPPLKPAGAKSKTVKKKIATALAVRKTAGNRPSKIALPEAAQASKKSLRVEKKKVSEKTKPREAAGTKKAKMRLIKPVLPKQKRKVGGGAKNRKTKSVPRERGDKVLEDIVRAELPEEYGENELILMAVDPNVVFVDWEIKKEEVPEAKDGFTMRVFDVTGSESLRVSRDVFLDMKLEGRVGRGFFELRMPGREVAIEIGRYGNGKFLPILRSLSVMMPRLLASDELGVAKKMFESGIPVGY